MRLEVFDKSFAGILVTHDTETSVLFQDRSEPLNRFSWIKRRALPLIHDNIENRPAFAVFVCNRKRGIVVAPAAHIDECGIFDPLHWQTDLDASLYGFHHLLRCEGR